ncbi:hypothetical protein [Anabaena sp. 4-3]|uniref:hypothetical protein n=1 Tax=Anabaena sp. 4-3 TaxID=1811979 RepID=UPI000A4B7C31|nr:hypothetical protein [Anabaena sp. 4-3]
MDIKQILEKLSDLISELETLINEADTEEADEGFISDLDFGLSHLQQAYERKNK